MKQLTFDIKDLFEKQSELDAFILGNHHLTRKETNKKRLIAVTVEFGEFLNEIRAFKFWSKKPSSPKDVILEEYVDALHFFLSIGLGIPDHPTIYKITKEKHDRIYSSLKMYSLISELNKKLDTKTYTKAFSYFLSLSLEYNFSLKEIKNAYMSKLQVNYNRQNNNY